MSFTASFTYQSMEFSRGLQAEPRESNRRSLACDLWSGDATGAHGALPEVGAKLAPDAFDRLLIQARDYASKRELFVLDAAACADAIRERLRGGPQPAAFARLASEART